MAHKKETRTEGEIERGREEGGRFGDLRMRRGRGVEGMEFNWVRLRIYGGKDG